MGHPPKNVLLQWESIPVCMHGQHTWSTLAQPSTTRFLVHAVDQQYNPLTIDVHTAIAGLQNCHVGPLQGSPGPSAQRQAPLRSTWSTAGRTLACMDHQGQWLLQQWYRVWGVLPRYAWGGMHHQHSGQQHETQPMTTNPPQHYMLVFLHGGKAQRAHRAGHAVLMWRAGARGYAWSAVVVWWWVFVHGVCVVDAWLYWLMYSECTQSLLHIYIMHTLRNTHTHTPCNTHTM